MSKSPHLLLAEEAPRGEVAASRAEGRPEPHAQTAELAKLDTFSVVGYTPVTRPHSRSALTCQHPLTPPLMPRFQISVALTAVQRSWH